MSPCQFVRKLLHRCICRNPTCPNFPLRLYRKMGQIPKGRWFCILYLLIFLFNVIYLVAINIGVDWIKKVELAAPGSTPAPIPAPEDMNSADEPWLFQSLPENEEEKRYYKFRKEIIHPFDYKFIINGSNICDEDTNMIILVHSSLKNIDNRRAIRRTWGGIATGSSWPDHRPINGKMKLAFVFGNQPNWTKALLEEEALVGGIIHGDFMDTYENLTLKSLLDFKWVLEFCPQVDYVVKSDDDMFINVPYLMNFLNGKAPIRRAIIGPYILGAKPFRTGKWKIGNSSFPLPNYPIYETGATYVITADIIGELFEAAKYIPQIFIDDVYITGILARTLGLYHARQEGFARYMDQNPSICNIILDKVFTIHRVLSSQLIDVWFEMFHTTKEMCMAKLRPRPTVPTMTPPAVVQPAVAETTANVTAVH